MFTIDIPPTARDKLDALALNQILSLPDLEIYQLVRLRMNIPQYDENM